MRQNYARHLAHLLRVDKKNKKMLKMTKSSTCDEVKTPESVEIPEEFNPKDWLSFLLHVDAELEHALMVQYLYAAYSIGGDHIAAEHKEMIRCWQEIILGISKEEMGHFVSIQNVLRVIGAPLNFGRQDFPWDSELYPFEFNLEPLSKKSLAQYIYAESPEGWITVTDCDDKETRAIKEEIQCYIKEGEHGDPISAIFAEIIRIIKDPTLIPDNVFLSETYPFQAKFDEWGRGYAGGKRGNDNKANPKGAPDVLVAPLLSRTDALNAINEIAEQGESTTEVDNEKSHFERFLGIYKQWRKLPDDFNPARNMASNPTISDDVVDPTISPSEGLEKCSKRVIDYIENEEAKLWAHLFNVRYRMLLTFLTHSFLLDDGFNNSGAYSPRGTIIHATFGEMYNLRSIATVLVRTPLKVGGDKMAGPPFLIPYTMDLPISETSRWRVHQDLLAASRKLIEALLKNTATANHRYLYSLKEADNKLNELAKKITNVPA